MGKEALYIPEEDLHYVIDLIRAGIKTERGVPKHVVKGLLEWCEGKAEYLRGSFKKEYWAKPLRAKPLKGGANGKT